MKINKIHSWEMGLSSASRLQRELAKKLELRPFEGKVELICGVDVAFSKTSDLSFAALVLLNFPELAVVEERYLCEKITFPYVPGYLSFREAPIILKLFESLNRIPDVVFVDGQGLAHPRGLGLASHIGLFLQIPTVGCAKSLLCGVYREPGITKGEKSPIYYKGRFCGYALRTQTRKKPVFVSPGNLVTFEDACRLALMTTTRYRIPEPTRIAHIKVSAYKRGYLSGSQR